MLFYATYNLLRSQFYYKLFIKLMAELETEVYEFAITILLVKMNVKFPCRMKLQYNGVGITNDVACVDNSKFAFNKETTLKEQSGKPFFEIAVNLITQKGGKYIAGVLKLSQNELSRSQGEKIVIPLSKCLDAQAFCQIRVDHVQVSKQTRKSPQIKSRVNFQSMQVDNLKVPKFRGNNNLAAQTRSQLQFPINSKKGNNDDIKSRYNAQSFYNRKTFKSPDFSPSKMRNQHRLNTFGYSSRMMDAPQFGGGGGVNRDNDNRQKIIQAEVYKQGYNKLKQKYKRQAEAAKNQLNKRITLQNSQNNLKLQIMRLKLKNQEQQKSITEKNNKLKDLQNQISGYQKKELDMGYLRQQLNNKDHTIRMLQQNIKTLNKDNQQLRNLYQEKTVSEQQKIKELKREFQLLRQKSETRQSQLERELKIKIQSLFIKQSQLASRIQQLNRQKKNVDELQRQSQDKTIQFEKMLQNEKNSSRMKTDELKLKIERLEKIVANLQNEKNQTQTQLEKMKSVQVKLQYENRVFGQETQSLKSQLAGMKSYKEKYSQIFRDHKLLLDDKNHLQKQLQRALQSKEMSTSQLNKQHIQQVEYFRKVNKQLDEKQRNLSNKIIQLQGFLETSKNAQQKLKRSLESATNQLAQTKQKEKVLKKTVKNKDQEILSLQNQLANIKQKTKSAESFYKHQIQKYKEELDKIKQQLQSQTKKCAQYSQLNGQISIELGKTKVKLQFTQQKVQKDAQDMKQKKSQMQNLIKDYDSQITHLNETIQTLRNNERQSIGRMQKQQIQNLKSQQKIQRMTKEIKILQDKFQHAQSTLKNRLNESSTLQTGKKEIEVKTFKLEEQISNFKGQISQLQAEKNKNQKMIELIQEENNKIRKQAEKAKAVIEQKEKNIDDLMTEIKKLREELTKSEIKLNAVTKDYERFKESTMDSLNNSFSIILAEKKAIQTSNFQLKKSLAEMMGNNNQVQTINPSEINTLILNYSKQTKIALSKLTQQNRQLTRENEKLQDQLAGNINRGQTSEYQYTKQIQDLQTELSSSYAAHEEECIKYDHIIKDLNARVRQKDRQIAELNSKNDDLNFRLNSAQVEHDNLLDQNSKKSATFKSKTIELEQKIQMLNSTILAYEDKIHEIQMECQGLKGALRTEKQSGSRKQRIIQELQDIKDQIEQEIEDGKRQRKELLEKNSTLQLLLNTEKQHNEKLRQMIEDEQQKNLELKTFIGNLMKQKEAVIKNQLEKSEQIIGLEGQILELTRDRDISQEDNKQYLKIIEENKENIKKLNISIKQIDAKLNQQRSKNQKLSEKLKEKEKQLINKQENIEKLQAKVNRINERGQKEGKQLRIQLQQKTQQLINLTKQHSNRSFQFEKDKSNYENIINGLKNQISNMEEEIFNLKHSHETRVDQVNALNGQISQLRNKIEQLHNINHQLSEEMREKQETAFQLSGKVYNLEMRLESKEIEKNQRLASIDNDWMYKYEGTCEQYEQKLELLEKERDYYRQRSREQQQELKKLLNEKNIGEIEDGKVKGILQEKVRQLQDDRLVLLSQKNNQLQKISQQNKMQFETLKHKESQMRKIANELEFAKSSVSKLQLKNKEMDEKIKSINRVYQAEIDQLKRKQAAVKNFKEKMSNKIWNSQRQVRRVVQSFVKKAMESIGDSKTSHRFIESMKGFQQTVAEAMKISIDELV